MKHFAIAIAATTAATMGSAQAATTTFTFDSSVKGQTSIVKLLDGIKLTASNFQTGPKSGGDTDGLAVYCLTTSTNWDPCDHYGQGGFQSIKSYSMTFDQPVKIVSYNVSYVSSDAVDSSTLYQQGALQSIQGNNVGPGLQSFANQFVAAANAPIAVTTTDPDNDGLLQINAFTVEKVIAPPPTVPGPLPVVGAAAAISWSRRLRGRISRNACD